MFVAARVFSWTVAVVKKRKAVYGAVLGGVYTAFAVMG